MGSAPTKPSRREGLFFDDADATSPDVSDDEDRPNQAHSFVFANVTCNSFDVSWKPPADRSIVRYQLRVFPPEGIRSKSLINSLETPSYTIERLTSGTRYTVGVVAVDENEKRSTCASASESTLPQPPTDIDCPIKQITASTFRVEWKASKGDRDYYEVDIRPTEGVTGKTSVTELQETHQVFTGLVPGTEYHVRVASVANGRRSEVLEKTVITNPGHVYDLTFPSVTHNEMQLVWKPPPGRVECYTLKLKGEDETEPVEIKKIKQTSYKFNGLVTGRNYQCDICTHALGKISMWKTFEQCTVPSEVSNLSVAKVTVDEAVITWSSAPGDVQDYDLFLNPREGVGSDPCPRGITGNMHIFKEPAPCGEISFPSDELKSTQIGVHWLPARGEADSYTVLVIKDGGTGGSWTQDDIMKASYLFTDLTPGAEYTFNITTLREGRHSVSKSASCSTLPCPAGIIDFPAGGTTSNSIKIAWNPSAGGVDSYRIQASGPDTKFEEFAKFDKAEFTIPNLIPGTKYEISVSVVSYGVESEPSLASRMTGPDRVGNLDAKTLNKNQIKVAWSPPSGGADAYDLTIEPSEGIDAETDPRGIEATEYTFERLVPGTLYTIWVTPVARGVWGPPAELQGYTSPGDILNVHFPADCVTTDSIKVVWGVEGNSKDVLVSLMSGYGDAGSQKISESFVQTSSEHAFSDLKEGTQYAVKLEAIGSSSLAIAGGQGAKGSAAIVTQGTAGGKAAEIEPEDDNRVPSPVQDPRQELASESAPSGAPVEEHNENLEIPSETSQPAEPEESSTSNDALERESEPVHKEENSEAPTQSPIFTDTLPPEADQVEA